MNNSEFCDDYERNVVPTLYGQATDTYKYICLALLIVISLYFFIALILFLWHKNTNIRLQSRSTLVMICLILSLIGMNLAVFLREYIGRTHSNCGRYAWALYLSFVFSGGAFIGYLCSYIYKLRLQRDQGFQLMNQQKASKREQQFGEQSLSVQIKPKKRGLCYYFYDFSTMLKYSKDGRIYFPGYDDKDDNDSMQGSEGTTALSLNFLFHDDQSEDFKWTMWDRIKEGIVYPIIIIYMFGSLMFFVAFTRVFTNPVFYNGCYGCQLGKEDYILFAINSALNALWITLSSYAIRNEPDPLEVVSDAKIGLIGYILTIPVCILQIYDPGNYHRDYKFTWDILFCIISCITFFPVVYGHLIRSYLERSKIRIQPTSNELSPRVTAEMSKHRTTYSSKNLPPASALDVNLIIQESRARNALLEHMINELSSENLVFVFKVRAWKDIWSKDQKEKVNRIAVNLYNEYISRSGKAQINISNTVYSKIEKIMSSYLDSSNQKGGNVSPKDIDKIPITAFDGCEAECIQIIKTDSLPRFRQSALFKERIIETGILDKVLIMSRLEEIQVGS